MYCRAWASTSTFPHVSDPYETAFDLRIAELRRLTVWLLRLRPTRRRRKRPRGKFIRIVMINQPKLSLIYICIICAASPKQVEQQYGTDNGPFVYPILKTAHRGHRRHGRTGRERCAPPHSRRRLSRALRRAWPYCAQGSRCVSVLPSHT